MELDIKKYEKIHVDMGYRLMTIADIYIPWMKCILKCECENTCEMSELDKIVCMCIEKEINNSEDISFVLSLDKKIVETEIDRLIYGNILNNDGNTFDFTNAGKELYLKKMKVNSHIENFEVYFNCITGEYLVCKDNLISDKEAGSDGIKLTLLDTIIKDDIENNEYIKEELENLYGTNIINMELSDIKIIKYYKENILFYQNEDKEILLEIYDAGKEELDIELTSCLRKKYEKCELLDIMKAERHISAAKKILVDNIKESHTKGQELQEDNINYVRNQEIRELFFKELEIAIKHLFIISPWITDFVVDNNMIDMLEKSLKRGVEVEIGFGYVSMEKMKWKLGRVDKMKQPDYIINKNQYKAEDKEIKSWEMAQSLKRKLGKYNNFKIFYIKEGTHEKIFSYDDNSILIGSYNLLSYDGGEKQNYQGFKFRLEGGVIIENEKFTHDVIENVRQSAIYI